MAARESLRSMLLAGRHSLSSGRVLEVTAYVRAHPNRTSRLIECLWDDDAGVRSRAADVLERVTRHLPQVAEPWKEALLGLMAEVSGKKVRWNLALSVPRLSLTAGECGRAAVILRSYLDDESSIVKTAAMQGMADLTRHDPGLRPEALEMLRLLSRSGTPAMRARGRILLTKLERERGIAAAAGPERRKPQAG